IRLPGATKDDSSACLSSTPWFGAPSAHCCARPVSPNMSEPATLRALAASDTAGVGSNAPPGAAAPDLCHDTPGCASAHVAPAVAGPHVLRPLPSVHGWSTRCSRTPVSVVPLAT